MRVTSIAPTGVRFVSAGRPDAVEGRSLIGAWGRWDALDRGLERGFLSGRSRFFGWSRQFSAGGEHLAGQVHLFLFPGGYCGLCRVEGGAVNLAGVIAERVRRRLDGGWEAVVAHARRFNPTLDESLASLREGPEGFLGVGPVFFTKKPLVEAENRMLMVGDAGGVIDPFSGEGQAGAIASGILAAEALNRAFEGLADMKALGRDYAAAWRRSFARRFGWGSVFRRFMLRPGAASVAARVAGPRLVRFAVERVRRVS